MSESRVAVALSSGGAKGLAHIGVLKALEEQQIPVHAVAGSSMGSLIGALFATGMKPGFLERLACSLRWRHWADFTMSKMGLVSGEKIRQMMELLTRGRTIDEADLPLAIVATELRTRSTVTFRSGKISDAVRASISIPGVFVPFVTSEGIYIDGGVMERVPVAAARALGADVVIGVDVAATPKTALPETMMDVIMMSLEMMQQTVVVHANDQPDVMLRPDVTYVGTSQFNRAENAIAAGYAAAEAAMDQIRELLAVRKDTGG